MHLKRWSRTLLLFLLLSTILAGQSSPKPRLLSRLDLVWVPTSLLKTISLSLQDIPLEQALELFAEEAGFQVSYNRDRIPMDRKVTLSVENEMALVALFQLAEMTGTEVVLTNGRHLALVPLIARPGSIKGRVTDVETGEPLRGVNVFISETYQGSATNRTGQFEIRSVELGRHTVQAMMMGYTTVSIDSVTYGGYKPVELDIAMEPTVIALDELVITPGHFSLMEDIPTSRLAIRAENIRSFPQLGEDIYRAVSRLPGITSNDFAAGFYVRGGENEQVLVLLDGMEIYKPFHMQELDGFMSIIDVEGIQRVDLISGAFPAEYGNRLSGVFNLQTISAQPKQKRTSVAISFLNARLLTENSFARGRGQWMLLARRGYMDVLMKNAGEDELGAPYYYDLLGKFNFNLNPNHSISAHFLTAFDRWEIPVDDEESLSLLSRHTNNYGWLTWHGQWNDQLRSRTLASYGIVGDLQAASYSDSIIFMDASRDLARYRSEDYLQQFGLKQDWTWDITDNYLLKFGFDAKRVSAHINYFHCYEKFLGLEGNYWTEGFALRSVFGTDHGIEFSSYISQRIRPLATLALELGLRYDREAWNRKSHWSPRLNLAYNLAEYTVARFGWGHYYQAPAYPRELSKYGDHSFYPAERAEHRVIGLEHDFANGVKIRVEGYQKILTSLQPHYINWARMVLNILPTLQEERTRVEPDRGEAVGVEFYLRRETGGALSYWMSYCISKTTERIDGTWVPRYYDQRHTFYCDVSWKPNRQWRLNLAWQYHSGWPYTAAKVLDLHQNLAGYWDWRWGPGPLYAERYPDYNRLDFRVNRAFHTRYGLITAFLEIRNILNHQNQREHHFAGRMIEIGDGTQPEVDISTTDTETWPSRVPSFGIKWDF
ncbi:MAG: TonB-dependent receptor [Fidelibacterota bacterium]|nr:MAG: TonB-dependent receptor [Candidatus Neomarinimicrobiota bacterium]